MSKGHIPILMTEKQLRPILNYELNGEEGQVFFVGLLALYVPHRCRELIFDPDDLSTYNLSEVSMLLGVGHISDGLLSPPVFPGVDSEPVGVI